MDVSHGWTTSLATDPLRGPECHVAQTCAIPKPNWAFRGPWDGHGCVPWMDHQSGNGPTTWARMPCGPNMCHSQAQLGFPRPMGWTWMCPMDGPPVWQRTHYVGPNAMWPKHVPFPSPTGLSEAHGMDMDVSHGWT